MHRNRLIDLLCLVTVYSIFILSTFLIRSVETQTLLQNKTNVTISHIFKKKKSKQELPANVANNTFETKSVEEYKTVKLRKDAPTFKGNIYIREDTKEILDSLNEPQRNFTRLTPVDYFSYLGSVYNFKNNEWADKIERYYPKYAAHKNHTKYGWNYDKYLDKKKIVPIDTLDSKIYVLRNKGISVQVPSFVHKQKNVELVKRIESTLRNSTITQLLDDHPSSLREKNDTLKYSGFGGGISWLNEIPQGVARKIKKVKNITLSNSDPIDFIQEKDNKLPNMKWSKDVLSEIPSNFPEKIVNFEYQHTQEQESNELDGKEGALFKRFLRLAVDFSFLSGSSLNGAVCMYKAVAPLMKIRWKTLNSINVHRMDTILKVMLGVPFFRYFEDKENMISSCINMFITMDMDSGEGLCVGKPGYEASILGISIADFNVDQYYNNKLNVTKENVAEKENNVFRPHDSANLIEMIYDDVCNYFYECMDEDISDDVNEYVFQNSHIFDVSENQRINFFKINQTPLFPDTSDRRSSVDALPSDWFFAALQQLSLMNAELPELTSPGLNIRDLGRLYFYAGRIGVQLPIRISLKMIYELSMFANHSPLLRRAYCTESLLKIINFKIADVLCKVSFAPIPLILDVNKLYTNLRELLKMISIAPTTWKKRPDPVCSEAEVTAEKYPNIIYPPDFVQHYSVRDKWSLYRSLALQLYGNIAIDDDEHVSSIVSMIHSLVAGYIKLNWDEFKSLYLKVGIIDPENYYSLLLSQRRGPALIELIAFSRAYNISVKIYKKVLRNSKREVYFELDEEITNIIEKLSEVDYPSIEIYNKVMDGNSSKKFTCKVLRLLVEKSLPPGFSQGVFKRNISNLNNDINGDVRDGSNWTWDAILPIYDTVINEKIISTEMGIQTEYKLIENEQNYTGFEHSNDENGEKDAFPPLEAIQGDIPNSTEERANWRRPTNCTFGQVLVSITNPPASRVKSLKNNYDIEKNAKLNSSTIQWENEQNVETEEYCQYYIIVQPLISFHQAGVYESRMFMNKIFEENQYFNWEDLPRRLDLEYLQSIIYVGDVYKSKKNLEIVSWKPTINKNNVINIFPENKMNSEIDSEDFDFITRKANTTSSRNESNANFEEVSSESYSTLLNETDINSAPEAHSGVVKLREFKKDDNLTPFLSPYSIDEMDDANNNPPVEHVSETDYIMVPRQKPWNSYVNLPKFGVMTSEPEFSFIPLNSGPVLPKKVKENTNLFKLDMKLLFSLSNDFWMIPQFISSRALYCFGKNIAPFLNNPNPSYIPHMLIYDRIISTVVSLLPVVDTTMSSFRPIQFVITVCEMALLDPIDLDQFLMINKNNAYYSQNAAGSAPTDLLRIFGKMPAIRNICASVANCIHSSNIENEYRSLINQASIIKTYNKFTPSSEQVILIQKLVPRFPEIVVIIKNLLRMIHFIGRKGAFLNKDTLYQIAKELSIAFHSISPYMWKSQINLSELYEYRGEYAEGIRQARRTKRAYYFIPVYDEAYWELPDRELLLFTCTSILTSRGILTLTAALVVCHYSFLRIPLSNRILSTIPEGKDLESDESLAADVVLFFLGDLVVDPIELLNSKEYNEDPIGVFTRIHSKWSDKNAYNMNTEMEKIAKGMFNVKSVLSTFFTYDRYIDFLQEGGHDLEYEEIRFERKEFYRNVNAFSIQNNGSYLPKGSFSSYCGQNGRRGEFGERYCFEDKLSIFWRYRPTPYKKDLRISQRGSSTDDIFESLSILLYATNSYKGLIKAVFTSALSLIKKICELENEIIKNSESKNSYIHVEGVDQEVVLFALSMCNMMRSSKEKMKSRSDWTKNPESRKLDRIEPVSDMHDLEIFEVIQFIYKVPIMVYEINQEQTIVRDTELNRRIYDLNDLNALAYNIKMARIINFDPNKPFIYMPIIPSVTFDDFLSLKNGVGPIPLEALLKGLNSVPSSMRNREKFKFRKRTAFDDASDNFFNRKQTPILFPEENYPNNSRHSSELVPILRRYIPYVPGDVEGKSLLQFIKITTAVIDLRRRPIKELPDKGMEKTFKSMLLDDRKLNKSRQHLMNTYGLNIDEMIEKNNLFGAQQLSDWQIKSELETYYDHLQSSGYFYNHHYVSDPYKFIIDYFNSVRHTNINPNAIHSFIDAERLRENIKKQTKTDSILEAMHDMLKYTTMTIFSEVYYYWSKLKYNAKKFSYENPIGLKISLPGRYDEEERKDKYISLYIKDKLDKIKPKKSKDSN